MSLDPVVVSAGGMVISKPIVRTAKLDSVVKNGSVHSNIKFWFLHCQTLGDSTLSSCITRKKYSMVVWSYEEYRFGGAKERLSNAML